ncbi:hypothetical protein ACFL5O_11850, partial [Myxococcota bacterium]
EGEQTQAQTAEGEQTRQAAGEGEGASEEYLQAMQQRQLSCLEAVARCGEAAGNPENDPMQLRESGNACDLGICGS